MSEWLHRSQASTWSQVVAHATHISMAPWDSEAWRHHRGFDQKQKLHISMCIPGFITVWGSSMDHRCQNGLLWYCRSQWLFEEVQFRKWSFPLLGSLLLPRAWGIPPLSGSFGAESIVCMNSRLLYIIPLPHPAVPTEQWQHVDLSLSSISAIKSPVLPLSPALFFLLFLPPPHHIFACCRVDPSLGLLGCLPANWSHWQCLEFWRDQEYLGEALYCIVYRCVILIYVLENDSKQLTEFFTPKGSILDTNHHQWRDLCHNASTFKNVRRGLSWMPVVQSVVILILLSIKDYQPLYERKVGESWGSSHVMVMVISSIKCLLLTRLVLWWFISSWMVQKRTDF